MFKNFFPHNTNTAIKPNSSNINSWKMEHLLIFEGSFHYKYHCLSKTTKLTVQIKYYWVLIMYFFCPITNESVQYSGKIILQNGWNVMKTVRAL